MKKLSLLMTLVMLVSLIGVASPAPVAADPIPGTIIQIPVIQVGGGWETWIQVQNVGTAETKFALLLFGYSGEYCGPQCKKPAKVEFSGRVPVGAAWSYKLASANTVDCAGAPFSPRSGILVSLSMAQAQAIETLACTTARDTVWGYWRAWWFGSGTLPAGQPAAVSVNRIQTGVTGLTPRAAAYTGFSPAMEDNPDPRTGAFMYYAPQLFDTFSPAGWSSRIWIQNSGDECTSLEIWFMKQQDCLKSRIQQVLALCPGETIYIDPDIPGFLGSAWIRATQPLGVIVDEYNANGSIFMSYRGMPATIWYQGEFVFDMGHLFNFAPLIYREYNGWNTGIVVQNLSSIYNALVKVYFIDNSGDIIDTIVDWVCPRGSQTFYLPAINNLPGMYVGQARVESQNWWGPGDPPVDAPTVMSVVNLVNYNTGQGAAYNTFPKQEALAPKVRWVALPFLAKDKRDPYEPSGTKWTSEIAMTNLDMFPGTSVWRIDFFDQNGLLYSLCQTLNEKQVDYIKLGNIGIIPPGWLGSAVISWQCSAPWDVGALGVVVVEKASGYPSGDLTKAYEGFPLFDPITLPDAVSCPECRQMPECYFSLFGTVTHHETGLPLNGVSIVDKDDIEVAKTDSTGRYFVRMLYSWSPNELHAVLEGYEAVEPVNVAVPQQPCNGAFEANFELSAPVCPTAKVFGTVIDCSDPALLPINGAKVYLDGVHKATTNSTGNYLIEGVDAGTYTLKVEKTGFFVCEQELVVLCGGQYLRDFELNCLAEVKVKVKDDCSGLAIQEATVSVDYTLCCPVGATGTATALTDSNGEATLIVPKGTWTFTISKDSYNTRVEKRAVACGKNDLTATPFSLWPTAWVKGTVFQTPGNPQMGAEVKLVDLATGGHLITTTDAQGKFQFLNVKPGWYVLRYMMGGVAICESAKFEIFYSDALNTAITRVEAMVALNNCTTQTLVGYACGVRVHSTGQLRKCVAAQPTGDPLAAADGMLQYYAAAWLNLPPSHSTGADGRVLFLVDPTGVPIGLPGNGIQYRILFSKTGYLPVAGQPTASITNANQNTMWFDDVCLTPP